MFGYAGGCGSSMAVNISNYIQSTFTHCGTLHSDSERHFYCIWDGSGIFASQVHVVAQSARNDSYGIPTRRRLLSDINSGRF